MEGVRLEGQQLLYKVLIIVEYREVQGGVTKLYTLRDFKHFVALLD